MIMGRFGVRTAQRLLDRQPFKGLINVLESLIPAGEAVAGIPNLHLAVMSPTHLRRACPTRILPEG